MGENSFSRDSDLTGLWSGEYWYNGGGRPTPFAEHSIDTLGTLTGTAREHASQLVAEAQRTVRKPGGRGKSRPSARA